VNNNSNFETKTDENLKKEIATVYERLINIWYTIQKRKKDSGKLLQELFLERLMMPV
jgi:hypothetical protein